LSEDETRRTGPGQNGNGQSAEDTRRTQAARIVFQDANAVKQRENWPPKKPKKPAPLWLTRTLAGSLLALTLFLVWVAISDVMLVRRGERLERELASEQVTDVNDIWNRWTELSAGNPSSWLLSGPRKAVKQKLVAAADHVIDGYRNSDVVYENGWKGARDDLAHALAMEPDDTVRGKLRIAEGHLARINGTTHRSPAELNEAVEKFTEAEKLLPRSPDPELGLARVYVYGLKDIDRADQALQDAEKRGYTLASRDKSQLADGYRERGDRLFWDSRNVRGLPQEKDQLQRVKQDYERSLGLYQAVAPWGNANASIVKVQSSLEQVDSRLQQIEQGVNVGPEGALRELPRGVSGIVKTIEKLWRSRAAKQ
jgi:tetratricopeptide (TPR) repeat protein